MDEAVSQPHLQRVLDRFHELPDGPLKSRMRAMLSALPAVLDQSDAVDLTVERLLELVARWRRDDPLTRFDAELRAFHRRLKRRTVDAA
jgi:hypothetical protein